MILNLLLMKLTVLLILTQQISNIIKVTVTYLTTDGTNTDNCTAIWVKQ